MKINSLSDLAQLSQAQGLVLRPGENNLETPNTKPTHLTPAQHKVRIMLETKGRAGKGVCVIRGLDFDATQLQKLCKELKNFCGTGGTVKDKNIEIQGDHMQKIMDYLAKQNIASKKAGG